MRYAWAKLPNGTTIEYGAPANYAIYPTKITDANGNYITITYRTYYRCWTGFCGNVQEGPNIETITDSVGRTIQFYYERQGTQPNETDLLTAVTAPGINGSAPRVLVRLQYDSKNLSNAGANYGFSGVTTHVRSSVIPVIKAIYYPATATGYWFGDANSYSNYGMLRKVSERRAMTCSAGGGNCADPNTALTQQASIGAGTMSREMVYSSSQAGYSDIIGSLTDTPTYTQMTEDWAARDTASPPVTTYSVTTSGAIRKTTIIRPDGVRIEQDTDNTPSSLYYGLLLEDRTYPDANSQTPLHRSSVAWYRPCDPAQDANNVNPHYCSPRPTRTEVRDERNQLTATDYAYGDYYNQVINKTEYGYGGTARLHRVNSVFENSLAYRGYWINRGYLWYPQQVGQSQLPGPQWAGPHIFNLVTDVAVYAANDSTRVAYTKYLYDESALVARSDATHLSAAPTQRGNLTTVKRYANLTDTTLDETTAVVETRTYDACGNIVTQTTACCEQINFEFNVGTQYGWPAVIKRGSTTDQTKQNVTDYGYDLNTGLLVNS